MNVLFVAPRNATKIFPVGLAYVIAALKRAGHSVDCLNLNLVTDLKIEENRFDIVATGGLACHLSDIEHIVELARVSGVKTVVGGGIVSSEPELMTRELQVDYAVIGEGEVTVCELLRCLENGEDVHAVPGLAFVENDRFFLTEPRKPIMDLDSLPYPDYESLGFQEHLSTFRPSDLYYLDYFDHPRGYPIVASRSCPFECTFCYHPLGRVYRQRSIDSIMEELQAVVPKYRINVIEILDELFSLDGERLKVFCERLADFRKSLSWELKWGCQLRVANIDRDTLEVLKRSGCYNLSLGLESYSKTVLDSMKKKITPDEIHKAVHCLLDTDLRLQGNFIFGDRAETMVTARETIDFWKKHSDAGILLSFVQPYPGSELYKHCLDKGIITDRIDFIKNHIFDTFNMTDIPDDEFFKLRLELLRLDFKFNRHTIPKSINNESIVMVCPHCNETITYNNFILVEKNSMLFSLRQSELFYNKMMYCRNCGRRYWARSLYAQLFTFLVVNILKYPSFAIYVMNVRNIVFALINRKNILRSIKEVFNPLEVVNRLKRGG